MREPYVPTQEDIHWLTTMLSILNDGGVLAYPATLIFYKVNQVKKTLTLMTPEKVHEETHLRTRDVAAKIGWTVADHPTNGGDK